MAPPSLPSAPKGATQCPRDNCEAPKKHTTQSSTCCMLARAQGGMKLRSGFHTAVPAAPNSRRGGHRRPRHLPPQARPALPLPELPLPDDVVQPALLNATECASDWADYRKRKRKDSVQRSLTPPPAAIGSNRRVKLNKGVIFPRMSIANGMLRAHWAGMQ